MGGFLQKVDRWIPRRVSFFRRGHARIFVHGVIDGFNCSLKLCLNKMKSSSKAFQFLCCSQKCWDFQCLNSHANITYVCTLYFGRDAGLPSLENEQLPAQPYFGCLASIKIHSLHIYIRSNVNIHSMQHTSSKTSSKIKDKLIHSNVLPRSGTLCQPLKPSIAGFDHQLNLWGSSRSLPLSHQQTSRSTCPEHALGAGCGLKVHILGG